MVCFTSTFSGKAYCGFEDTKWNPSRQFWDRRRWKSGLSIVIWDCGRWKSGPCLLGCELVTDYATIMHPTAILLTPPTLSPCFAIKKKNVFFFLERAYIYELLHCSTTSSFSAMPLHMRFRSVCLLLYSGIAENDEVVAMEDFIDAGNILPKICVALWTKYMCQLRYNRLFILIGLRLCINIFQWLPWNKKLTWEYKI